MKLRAGAIGGLLALCLAAPAWAAPVHFLGDYDVTYQATDPGLVIAINPITPLSNGLNFSLEEGQATFVSLFEIYTNETFVNFLADGQCDDVCARPISVDFAFTAPDMFGGAVEGETNGFRTLTGSLQFGLVTWDNGGNLDLGFGDGGLLRVHLDDGIFNLGQGTGFLGLFNTGLDEGPVEAAVVTARFELVSDGVTTRMAAAPEPATWALMIGGFGMAGSALRRRRASAPQPA